MSVFVYSLKSHGVKLHIQRVVYLKDVICPQGICENTRNGPTLNLIILDKFVTRRLQHRTFTLAFYSTTAESCRVLHSLIFSQPPMPPLGGVELGSFELKAKSTGSPNTLTLSATEPAPITHTPQRGFMLICRWAGKQWNTINKWLHWRGRFPSSLSSPIVRVLGIYG